MWSNEEATNHILSAQLLDSLILCDILITRLGEPGQTKIEGHLISVLFIYDTKITCFFSPLQVG